MNLIPGIYTLTEEKAYYISTIDNVQSKLKLQETFRLWFIETVGFKSNPWNDQIIQIF